MSSPLDPGASLPAPTEPAIPAMPPPAPPGLGAAGCLKIVLWVVLIGMGLATAVFLLLLGLCLSM
jgi:hypothetical protein